MKKKEINVCRALAIISTGIVAAVGVYAIVMRISWGNLGEQGQFGDQFGAINALFSGLAFAVLIGTIILQGRELKAQRKELKLTRQEMRLARVESKKSAEAQAELVNAQFHSARIGALSSLVDAQIPFIENAFAKGKLSPSSSMYGKDASDKLEKYCQMIVEEIRSANSVGRDQEF